ncbi:dynamin family protein [Brevibacillus centrosporus]|uniref:dynamin family protein n=1 Tax=Brevibacillus centrosporus TaxID=54910 RepID=UPI002E209A85|nr:dynamin family protein [Brevibacillus centrosporus]
MSFSLQTYKKKRLELLQILDQYRFVLEEMEEEVEQEKVLDRKVQITEDHFQIAVVGEFSRGKSTFINSLLGKRLLPSSPSPTTAILNIINYQRNPSITLHYRDEQTPPKRVTEEEFARLVAPKEPILGDDRSEREFSEKNHYLQTIRNAEIGHPLSFCEEGIQIIDTPGTNDLDPKREQITNEIIPRSDAAILLLSATKILSASELDFLRNRLIDNDLHKIFVVINYMDKLKTEEDRQKVIAYARENLRGVMNDPKIFMVSAREALNARRTANGETIMSQGKPAVIWDLEKTGVPELERALAHFLQNERGAVKLKKPIKQLSKSIDSVLEKRLAFERASLTHQLGDLEEKVQSFGPKIQKVKESGQEAISKILLELKKKEDELSRWYDKELQAIYSNVLAIFDNNRNRSKEDIKSRIENALGPMERELHQERKEKIKETMKQVVETMSRSVNEEWIKLDQGIHRFWDVEGSEDHETSVAALALEEEIPAYSIFEEIYEELDQSWERSTSKFAKAAIIAGFTLTAIANGVTAILSYGFNWLFGDDGKTRLRNQLDEQYRTLRKEKLSAFRSEWKGISSTLKQEYEHTIQQHLKQIELQLRQIRENARLSEVDIQLKLEILHRREIKLKDIKNKLSALYLELDAQNQKMEITS